MVGYPESLTDPSYRGQILVITYPLVGNYGVPSREERDKLLDGLPAYFESNEIHIAGLIVASYSGEDYSHYLAESSLGSWLKEQGVPAIYGIDTRALTKKIREQGSMLGKMLLEKTEAELPEKASGSWRDRFESVDWVNPNAKNLVADGKLSSL
jgi:carbamoyl-phosphate synthase/aspartate carbamoyltransferase